MIVWLLTYDDYPKKRFKDRRECFSLSYLKLKIKKLETLYSIIFFLTSLILEQTNVVDLELV